MKISKTAIIIIVVGILLLCICSVAAIAIYIVVRNNQTANNFVLIKDSGTVYYRTDKEYVELKDDQTYLATGSYVKTSQGLAHILLPDNSLISLDNNTELQVKFDQQKVDVVQMVGNSWHRVQKLSNSKDYKVETPSLIAAVRGTIFGVNISQSAEIVFVEDSKVEVGLENSNSKENLDADQSAIFTEGDLKVDQTSDNLKNSLWYMRNKKLDDTWKRIDSTTNKDRVINDLNNNINESRIKDVPGQINTFLDQSLIDELTTNGFKVNTGSNPPNIEGTFHFDNWTVKFDKMDVFQPGQEINECDYTFSKQTSNGTLEVSYSCASDYGSGTGAFVSGNSNCFTVYVNQYGNYKSCNYNMPAIISGCLETQGIKNLQYSNLLVSKEDTQTCTDNMMPTGNYRIISINDAFADRIN